MRASFCPRSGPCCWTPRASSSCSKSTRMASLLPAILSVTHAPPCFSFSNFIRLLSFPLSASFSNAQWRCTARTGRGQGHLRRIWFECLLVLRAPTRAALPQPAFPSRSRPAMSASQLWTRIHLPIAPLCAPATPSLPLLILLKPPVQQETDTCIFAFLFSSFLCFAVCVWFACEFPPTPLNCFLSF